MNLAWNRMVAWITPAVLCAVAAMQFGYARFATLSPWKGGGFGMFSTVDSPGARFLRIYLLTDQGEIPIQVPERWRASERELRTTGSETVASELARALADGTWIRLRLASATQHYQSMNRPPSAAATDTTDQETGDVIDLGKLNLVRMLKPRESPAKGDVVVSVDSVRVEVWKYQFDKSTTTLHAAKFMDISASPGGHNVR